MKKNISKKSELDTYRSLMIDAIKEIDVASLEKLIDLIWQSYKSGNTVFFAGNGGSASTASHLAADIGKNITVNYKSSIEKRIKTLSLCDNIAWMTAVGNDITFDDIFLEQLKNLAKKDDLLIVISGSGNSINIVKMIMWARKNNLHTAGILGFDGGYLKEMLELSYIVNSDNYGIVESMHSYIHHYIVESLKRKKKEEII